MRSYYAHLETAVPVSPDTAISPRPTFRSSAIFPMIQQNEMTSRILFMGYWMLKRNIREIACVISLRDQEGVLLGRHHFLIQEAKTFRIELADELEHAGKSRQEEFTGSLEVEFFSTQNLFFPYPAVVVNYYGPNFSTVVHTAQRVYNDFDDMAKNSQTEVPESGFNIYVDQEREPFIALINGSTPVNSSIMQLQFINSTQDVMECRIDLGQLAPYQTKLIYPARSCQLRQFLKDGLGAVKLKFHVNWIFPRLLVGNIHHKIPALTITHTYYDCSAAKSESDYWRPEEPGWHSAALMLPIEIADDHFTNVYFYPIYSPAAFSIDVEIYHSSGKFLGVKRDAVLIQAPLMEFHCIPLKSLCQELGIGQDGDFAARLIAHPRNSSRVPSRIKIGLDVGLDADMHKKQTPCNICTNLQPFNPALEGKPSSFRWSPILADQPHSRVWIMNSSPAINYQRPAEVNMTFFRENDSQTLTRRLEIPPHGFQVLHINEDQELMDFFGGKVGWMTAITTNPYTTTYYFAENPSGVVGGDHGF